MLFTDINVAIINLILSIAIFILGLIYYKKIKAKPIFIYISIAFGFFGIGHFITIYSIKIPLYLLVIVRTLAYIILSVAVIIRVKTFLKLSAKSKIVQYLKEFSLAASIVFIGLIFYLAYQIFNILKLGMIPQEQLAFLNLIFCIIILTLSFITHSKSKEKIYLFLGLCFTLFAFSHLIIIFNLQKSFNSIYVFLRITGYFIPFLTLYELVKEKTINIMIKITSSAKMQMSIVIITVITIIVLFYYPFRAFLCTDPKPLIYPIKPILSEKPIIKIKTGLFVKSFPVLDITNNNFIMNAIIWFKFDPHLISLDTISKFAVENGTIIERDSPETKITENELLAKFKIKIQFKSTLDYKFFPFEDHTIYLSVINTALNPDEAVLISYNTDFVVDKTTFEGEWKNSDEEVEFGILESIIDPNDQTKNTNYPLVVFSIDIKNEGVKKALVLLVPLFIAFFLSLFSLVININNKSGILSLSVGSVSTIVFNLVVLVNMTPNVRYFTITDSIFTALLLIIFLILLLNIYLVKQIKENKATKNFVLFRNYTFLFFIIFIVSFIYHILY